MIETMPSHMVQKGMIGMIYVKRSLENLNGLKKGVNRKKKIG
jgi:hypothetical protein